MDSTPPRPPNLSELAEMGERAKERMIAQRTARAFASGRGRAARPPVFRGLAAALTILSAVVFVLFWNGQGQCAVPMYQSLSLYGPPMSIHPGLCAVESVAPIWLVAVIGILLGLWYLHWSRPDEIDLHEGPTER